MSAAAIHAPGDTLTLRHVYRGKAAYVIPTTVVRDEPGEIALYVVCGTPLRWTIGIPPLATGDFRCDATQWRHTNVLQLTPRESWYSVWLMWEAVSRRFLCWYVNFQRPLRRTALGYDTADLSLDLVVAPDRRWQWKDEEDFALLQELGLADADDVAAVRAAGDAVVPLIEAGAYPFDATWQGWRPDAAWGVPGVPDEWDRVEEWIR